MPPIGILLAKSLRKRWQDHCRQWKRCAKHCSEDSVHELRVATRRLMAHLSLIQVLAPGKTVPSLRNTLKERLSSLGDVRDIHVQRLAVKDLSRRFDGLGTWGRFLKKRERKLVAKVGKCVASWKKRSLQALLEEIESEVANQPVSSNTQRLLLEGAVRTSFDETCARLETAKPDQPRTIHRLRIAFKGYRYRLEAISPALTGLTRRQLLPLARYQRRMGTIQDLEVLKEGLLSFLARHPMRSSLLKDFIEFLDRRRERAVADFFRASNNLRNFWPASGLADKQRRHL